MNAKSETTAGARRARGHRGVVHQVVQPHSLTGADGNRAAVRVKRGDHQGFREHRHAEEHPHRRRDPRASSCCPTSPRRRVCRRAELDVGGNILVGHAKVGIRQRLGVRQGPDCQVVQFVARQRQGASVGLRTPPCRRWPTSSPRVSGSGQAPSRPRVWGDQTERPGAGHEGSVLAQTQLEEPMGDLDRPGLRPIPSPASSPRSAPCRHPTRRSGLLPSGVNPSPITSPCLPAQRARLRAVGCWCPRPASCRLAALRPQPLPWG